MIIRDPYGTKALKLHSTKGVVNDINRYIVTDYGYLKSVEPIRFTAFQGPLISLNPIMLYGSTESEKDITPLAHPYFSLDDKWAVLDLRRFVTLDPSTNKLNIRNESEYKLHLIRYTLSSLWMVGNQSGLYGLELPHFAFATWLSDNLAHKFGLELGDKIRLRVLSSIYYTRMFSDEVDDDELNLLLIRTKKDLIIPDLLKEIHAMSKDMQTIEDFCNLCYEVTGNVRLKGLDYAVLVNVLLNNWLGAEGKVLTMMALEHPPTWVSLCYAALTQRNFKKSFVTTVVEKHSKRGKDQEFVKAVEVMTKNRLQEI